MQHFPLTAVQFWIFTQIPVTHQDPTVSLFSVTSITNQTFLEQQENLEECRKRGLFIFRPPPKYWLHIKHVLIKSAILFEVIGAASKDKLDVVTSMGASATIDYNKESIKDKVYTFVLLIKVFLIISCNCPNNHSNKVLLEHQSQRTNCLHSQNSILRCVLKVWRP